MQTPFHFFLAALLAVPAVTLACLRTRKARLAAPVLLILSQVTGAAVAGTSFWTGTALRLRLPDIGPFACVLTVDRLSAFFLLLICAVGAPVALFSSSYIERHYAGVQRLWIWVLLPLFLASMVLVVTASTAFAFLAGWELMTLFSASLIVVDGDSGQRPRNLFIYLLMMHAGAAAVVGAFLFFTPHAAELSFSAMRGAAASLPPGLRTAIFVFAFAGFGTKAGIIPLHLWLPRAHPIAPTPVSALMSGVMLKTAVYGFVRFAFDFLGGGPSWWGYLVLLAGAVSGVLGVLYAIAEHDLKRLLAYHSVENIGIIYLGLGAALVFMSHNIPLWATLALLAGLLHTLNHALFKSLLFLGAGAIADAAHTLDIEELGGLLKRMPVSGAAFLVACCSIIGLPLFNGFVSEWLTFRSFLAGSNLTTAPAVIVLPLMTGVLGLIGGLAVACFAKVYGVVFLGRPRSAEAEHASEVPVSMRAALTILAVACVLIGVVPGVVMKPLSAAVQEFMRGAAMPAEVAAIGRVMPWIALGVVGITVALLGLRPVVRLTPTWACGLPGLDTRMQYTSTAFSKPLRKVFAWAYRPERTVEALPQEGAYFPVSISYRSVRTTSYEKWVYRPALDAVVGAAHRLRRLQTGNIQIYLLYIFIVLVALLVFMRFA
jgi:hydrogenase-4 component B